MVLDPDRFDNAWVNRSFIELLTGLSEMAGLMEDAQSDWVWVRNWQWPLALKVRVLTRMGIERAATYLGLDPEQPNDPLLLYALGEFEEGVDLIEDRKVDAALEMYIGARCLVAEVYNHAGFEPPAVPPEAWECDSCVMTGDCVH